MIAVYTPDAGADFEYPDASRWHVDESGHLHIVGANNGGNVATFQSSRWLNVEKRDTKIGEQVAVTFKGGITLRASSGTDLNNFRSIVKIGLAYSKGEYDGIVTSYEVKPAQALG